MKSSIIIIYYIEASTFDVVMPTCHRDDLLSCQKDLLMQLDSKSPGQLNPLRYFIVDATYCIIGTTF